MKSINLEKWRGKRDPVVLDPAAMEFAAKRHPSCAGCLFDHQWASTCDKAMVEASKRGLPRCDDGYIYAGVEKDARQLDMVEE